MHVYIMRHGEAAIEAASDALRPLTAHGQDESQQIAQWLASQNTQLSQVFVSPYLRAQQTLAVMQSHMTLPSSETTLAMLTPEGDAREISDFVHALAEDGVESVLIVSHLPLVGYLVAELCPQEQPPMFATAGVACIDYQPTRQAGDVLWHISPAKLAHAI